MIGCAAGRTLRESMELGYMSSQHGKEGEDHYRKYGRSLKTFKWNTKEEGRTLKNCPVCTHQQSVAKRWRYCQGVELITEIRKAGCRHYEQLCHAMYNKTKFQDHLCSMDKCIYHNITSKYLTLINKLRGDHGQKVLLSVHAHIQTSFVNIMALAKVCSYPVL